MSGDDELLPEGVPGFDDPAYDALRAELAGARADAPMPDDVVARLDSVLAGLGGSAGPGVEGADDAGDAPIPLRRRSRLGGRLLAAAAAVVVLAGGGVGLAKVLNGDSSTGDSSLEVSAGAGASGNSPLTGAQVPAAKPVHKSALTLPSLSSAHFGTDVSRLMQRDAAAFAPQLSQSNGTATTGGTAEQRPPGSTDVPLAPTATPAPTASSKDGALSNLDSLPARPPACAPRIPGAQTEPILLDGRPAVLVLYPVVGGHRLVEARDCAGKTVLASTSLPS